MGKKSWSEIKIWAQNLKVAIQRNDKVSIPKCWRPFNNFVQIVKLIVKYFIERRIHVRAAALTYYTAFAMVPLMAFIMAIGRGFGFDSYIEELLMSRYHSHAVLLSMVMEFIDNYLEQLTGGLIWGVGVMMLLWSIYRMFNQIERAFNDIWGIEARRPITYRITNYVAIMFFVPVLIFLTSGVLFYFRYAMQYFTGTFFINPSLRLLLNIMPYFVAWLVLTLLYWLVPNTQVKFKYAAISGFIFGFAFMIFKGGYVYAQTWMTRYNAVYGALAAIPILLVFLQGVGVLVLLGCAFTFSAQCLNKYEHADDVRKMSHRYFEFASLVVTKICVDRKLKFCETNELQSELNDKDVVTLAELSKEMPYRMAKACVDKLCRSGILMKVEKKDGSMGYTTRIDLSDLSFSEFYACLDIEGTSCDKFSLHTNPNYAYLWKFIEQNASYNQYDDVLLSKLKPDVSTFENK